ncbi:MAG: hypothetical protein FWF44_02030 [Defluviitaleaceae bacterium]|nr:hypothetical protein [Defluviitaleaceae bacterium]
MVVIELGELKNILQNYRAASGREKNIRREIERVNDRIDAMRDLSARTYSMASGGRSLSDVTYLKAEKIIDTYDREITALLDEIGAIQRGRARLNGMLAALSPEERDVITAKYLDNIKWDFMPEKVHISRAQCFRVHDRAIVKMLNMDNK